MTRPRVIPCSALGGRSSKTGRRVGKRHRWTVRGERLALCAFCFSERAQVIRKAANG